MGLLGAAMLFTGNSPGGKQMSMVYFLVFVVGMIAFIELVIRLRKRNSDKTNPSSRPVFTPTRLELKTKNSFLVMILAVVPLFLIIGVQAYREGDYAAVAAGLFLSLICIYALKLWGKTLLIIDEKGITHHKLKFIPWSDILSAHRVPILYRGLKVGERIDIVLTHSLRPVRSKIMKTLKSFLLADIGGERRTIATKYMNQPIDLVYNTIQAYMRKTGAGLEGLMEKSLAHSTLIDTNRKKIQSTNDPDKTRQLDRQVKKSWAELHTLQEKILSNSYDQLFDDPILRGLANQQKTLREQQYALLNKLERLAAPENDKNPDVPAAVQQLTKKFGELDKELRTIQNQISERSTQITSSKIRRVKILMFLVYVVVFGGMILYAYMKVRG